MYLLVGFAQAQVRWRGAFCAVHRTVVGRAILNKDGSDRGGKTRVERVWLKIAFVWEG